MAAISLLAAVSPSTSAAGSDPIAVYRVGSVATREARTTVARTGAGIDEVGDDYLVVRATPAERNAIKAAGFPVEAIAQAQDFPSNHANYHNFAEMQAAIDALDAAHTTVHQLAPIGLSYEGRPLEAVRISDDANDITDEPGVLYIASQHGREHLTVEVALDVMRHFAESTDPAVAALVASRQIYVLPNLNPDGSEYDIATGKYRSWRKNRQPNGANAPVGTDLNRNFSYRWGCCGGSSSNKGSETYRGSAPFSAPEMAALRDFVNAHPNITTAISYHSYGNLILYPYGYTYTDIPSDMDPGDHQTFVAMARQMANTTGYRPQQSSELYITDGDFKDWMYGENGAYPFTFELGGGTFYPDDSRIPIEQAKNRDAAVYAASMADCPRRAAGLTCDGTPPPPSTPVTNGGFEADFTGWSATRASIVSAPVNNGSKAAALGGTISSTSRLTQTVTVPASGQLQLYVRLAGAESNGKDVLRVRVVSGGNTKLHASLTSAAAHDTWQLVTADLAAYAGRTVELRLIVTNDGATPTTFFVDDVTL